MIPNKYHIQLTLYHNYQVRTGNNVSEFMHSNWIMLSYYSSPKHKESASQIFDTLPLLLYTVI